MDTLLKCVLVTGVMAFMDRFLEIVVILFGLTFLVVFVSSLYHDITTSPNCHKGGNRHRWYPSNYFHMPKGHTHFSGEDLRPGNNNDGSIYRYERHCLECTYKEYKKNHTEWCPILEAQQ